MSQTDTATLPVEAVITVSTSEGAISSLMRLGLSRQEARLVHRARTFKATAQPGDSLSFKFVDGIIKFSRVRVTPDGRED